MDIYEEEYQKTGEKSKSTKEIIYQYELWIQKTS